MILTSTSLKVLPGLRMVLPLTSLIQLMQGSLPPGWVNSTASTLSFDITEEDHRDRVIVYSCFLVRNNPNRDRDESEPLVLDPPGVYLYASGCMYNIVCRYVINNY